MGKNTKESLVKQGIELAKSTKSTEEEQGDHPVALMISEVFTLSLMEP